MSSQPRAHFARSRWSTITRVASADHVSPMIVLGELASRFRYPVYAYLRTFGFAPSAATAHTRMFLRMLEAETQAPSDTRFRRFYNERLAAWLADDRVKRADGSETPDVVLEARYRRDGREGDTVERAFARAFAMEVLARACTDLEAEARETGHRDMYAALLPWLAKEPPQNELDAIARTLGTRPLTVLVALKRLRQRLRELASAELADIVTSPEDLAAEQRTFLEILEPGT